MKKLLILSIIFTMFMVGSAAADGVDLSGMSFDELVALRDQLNIAIWNSQEWQEVTVPAGIWEIGVDIPAGYWTVTPDNVYASFWYGDKLNDAKTDVGMGWDYNTGIAVTLDGRKKKDGTWKNPEERHQISIDMKEGMFIKNTYSVIFTPYAGKPDLGFK